MIKEKNISLLQLLFLVTFFLASFVRYGYAQSIQFENIKYDYLLDNVSVLSITRDNEGRLWFGGKEKLFVYDSRIVKNFVQNNKFAQLPNLYINKIIFDKHNNLFIGTATGLLIFDKSTQSFLQNQESLLIKEQVNEMHLWNDKILIGTSKGLYFIDFNTKQKKYFVASFLDYKHVFGIETLDQNSFIFSSEDTLLKFTASLDNQTESKTNIIYTAHSRIKTIHSHKGKLWLGTTNNGVIILDRKQNVRTLQEENSKIASNNIRKIISHNDKVYVATLKGLSIIENEDEIENYSHHKDQPWSLTQNSIYDLYLDNQDILWIGTYYGGLNAIFPNKLPIETLTSQHTSRYRLNSEIISSFCEDEEYVYIGSDESGLQRINKKTKASTSITPPSPLVKHLLLKDDKLYIALNNEGLCIYDTKSNRIIFTIGDKEQYKDIRTVNKIFLTRNNEILLASFGGVYSFNEDYSTTLLSPKSMAYNLCQDSKGNIYSIINDQLWIKPQNHIQFTCYEFKNDLPNAKISAITPGNSNNIYFATTNEVYEIKEDKISKIYTSNKYTIKNLFALDNHLWIASMEGLIQYDLYTKKEYLLNAYDGLTTTNLTYSDFYKSADNKIYLSTLKGINIIQPQAIKYNLESPHVLLNNITVLDSALNFYRSNLENNTYSIVLPYDRNHINFEFSSSNFIKPLKNRYKYKLSNFDTDWRYTSTPIARYMNLDEGTYTLEVYASNNDGIWSENPLLVEVKITPPFWKTWWAYVFYLLAFLSALYFVIKFIVERQLLINSEKEVKKKIKFFTQISHEIRTPLTLISVHVEDILKSTSENSNIKTSASKLQKNTHKLLNIINELLDFKKIDDNKENLNLEQVNFKQYLEESFYTFSDLAITKDLNFYIDRLDIRKDYAIDPKQFDKVLYNLFSNAIKYSKNKGTVYLEAFETSKNIIINVVDNGIGIAENNQFKIFEEYYRDPNAQDIIGTGIGLALTKKIVEQHNGKIECSTKVDKEMNFTVFSISLPLNAQSNPAEIKEGNGKTQQLREVLTKNLEEKTLLIVEDNKELSDSLAHLFKDHFITIQAFNGHEGIDLANKYLPDIIITDLMMPVMNGIEMVENLKKNFITSHIPIIMLTADITESSQISGLKFGANIYLEKPFNTTILQFTVNNLVQVATKNRVEFDIRKNNVSSDVDKEFILKLENIIQLNIINSEFGVDFLAREIGMSQPILYKKIKSITNLSVNNFIKQYRLKKAMEMLRKEDSISEIAYAVGFSDRKYFSREFKKHFGLNPSEYIEQHKISS